MWVFSKTGFVSIVQHREEPEILIVRARVLEDLEEFAKTLSLKSKQTVRIEYSEKADYAFRLYAERKQVVAVVRKMVADINYDNFKKSVEDDSPDRSRAYMKCWASMNQLQAERLGEETYPQPAHNQRPLSGITDRFDLEDALTE